MSSNVLTEERKNVIARIISDGMLSPVYQPIVSLKDGSIYAYEALSRITYKNASISVSELFEIAGQCGYLWELEKLCRTNALKNATKKPQGVKLFINVDGNVLRDSNFIKGFTKEKLNAYSLKADDIVFEITERSNSDNYQLLRDTMEHYREQGYEVALDDLGSGYSGLNRLQNIKPEYVKIDYELIHNIDKDKSKKCLVRMLVRYCNEMDYKLIAEGIETEDELHCLINIGVKLGQGFLLGRPDKSFISINNHIVRLINKLHKKKKDKNHNIENIGKMGTIVYPSCSVEHVNTLFSQNNKISYIGIVDSNCKFYGLIYPETVAEHLTANPKTTSMVIDIMDKNILEIDSEKSLKETIGRLMTRDETDFYKPFAIIRKKRYFGTATIRDVLIAAGKAM